MVVGGKLVKSQEFVSALKQLHGHITANITKKIPVVVSISDADVYSQQFVLPQLKSSSLEEAARLNLQVISPIDFSKSYSDWQKIDNPKSTVHEVEILASFIEKETIDPIYKALLDAQFVPVAIEQRAASLIRLLVQLANSYNDQQSHFLLYVSSDGLGFALIRNNYLYFNRFTSWSSILHSAAGQRQISVSEFSDTIIQESHRIMNFYSSHFNDAINSLYIIAPGLEEQVKQIIENSFPIKVEPFSLKNLVIEQQWYVALGAALRGSVPRAIDVEISLAPEGTEIQFYHSRVIAFAILWRNVLVSVLTIALVSTAGVYLLMSKFTNDAVADLNLSSGNINSAYLDSLKNEAVKFNRAIDRAMAAKQTQSSWSKVLADIYAQAGTDSSIVRIYMQSIDSPIILNGTAINSNAAIDFKNKLAALPYISSVDLPLSSLTSDGTDSGVSFTISFKVASPSSQ